MDTLLQDIRYGLRVIVKNPGVSVIAILTLALGIGANSAIFSVVNAVMLRSLPYEQPERIMFLNNAPLSLGSSLSVQQWFDWKDHAKSFESLAAFRATGEGVNLTTGGEPDRINATEVTSDFFHALGVNMIQGRSFGTDEQLPGKNHVVVISYGLWKSRFGSDSGFLGKEIILNGISFVVIGITPAGMQYPEKVDAWVPVSRSGERLFSGRAIFYNVIGRLKSDTTLSQSRAEASVFSEWLKQEFPNSTLGTRGVEVTPLHDQLINSIRQSLLVLFGAVAVVLLIACANVTSILLGRAAARQKEIAIRAALGAGRFRLVRQLLSESLLLSLTGGLLGLLVASWGISFLLYFRPAGIPRLDEIKLDGRVIAFTLGVSLVTGVLFGILPALQGSKVDLNNALKDTDAALKHGTFFRAVRSVLVVTEIALALILMVGAGLLIKSLARLQGIDSGFKELNALTINLDLPDAKYTKLDQKIAFYDQLIEQLRPMPGIAQVGATSDLPFGGAPAASFMFSIEGQPPIKSFKDKFAMDVAASADYFQAMGITLIQGRYFTDQDRQNSLPVAILDQSMVQRFWPNENPIGKRIKIDFEKGPREIVGVVSNVKQFDVQSESPRTIYLPYQQGVIAPTSIVITTAADPTSIVALVRDGVRKLDKDLPLYSVKTMKQRVSDSLAEQRFIMLLLGIFAGIAMVLSAIGIYGVMSFAVTQRTREIGIRMALGAQRGQMLRMMLSRGLALTLIGIALGVGGAIALTRLMTSLLYEVTPNDKPTLIIISVMLAVVAMIANYIPAHRSTKIDPMVAMRSE